MAAVNPVPKEKAASELNEIYDNLTQKVGHMPNIFGAMAHRPEVLKAFLPLYSAVVNRGTIESRYKELAYLKTSTLNTCEY